MLPQHDRPQGFATQATHRRSRIIPFHHFDTVRRRGHERRRLLGQQRSRQLDTAVPARIVHRRHREPLGVCQRIAAIHLHAATTHGREAAHAAAAPRHAFRPSGGHQRRHGPRRVVLVARSADPAHPLRGDFTHPRHRAAIERRPAEEAGIERTFDRLHPEFQVDRRWTTVTTHDVALLEQRRHHRGAAERGRARVARQQHQVRQARMRPHARHRLAVRRDPAGGIERAEARQQLAPHAQGGGRRRIEPRQLGGVAHPVQREVERQAAQVGIEDLGSRCRNQAGLLRGAPAADRHARRRAARASATLVRRRPGDPHRLESRHAGARRMARHPLQPAIHHHPDPLDRERGLGHVGGQHHLAPSRRSRRDRRVLGPRCLGAEEGMHRHVRWQAAVQPLRHPMDLRRPRQEGQDRSGLPRHRVADHAREVRIPALCVGRWRVAGLHRPGRAAHAEQRRITQEIRHRGTVHGGRHHHDPEVVAHRRGDTQHQGQRRVGHQRPLVELVEQHRRHALERGIIVQHPKQHALGDHLDARGRAHLRLATDAIAEGRTHRLAAKRGHASRCRPRRQATRLQHHDAAASGPRRVEQCRRHPGGLARTRLGNEHGPPGIQQGSAQGGEHGLDREHPRNVSCRA